MRRANRWFLYGPFLVAALALAAWFAVWRTGAETMRRTLADFAAAEAANGVRVEYAPLRAKGYPFFLRGAVEDFSVERGDDAYRCSRLYIDALPYQPDRIIFSCGGEQHATIDGRAWRMSARNARASIERDRARGWIIRSETGALTAESAGEVYSARSVMLNLAPDEAAGAAVDVSIRALGLQSSTAPDIALERVDAAFKVIPSDSSGRRRIDILGLEAAIDDSVLSARGVLHEAGGAYDGRLDAELDKPVGIARAAAGLGLLTAEESRAAEAGLAMLAVASGGKIAAPIIIENNEIRLAGVRLGRIARKDQP